MAKLNLGLIACGVVGLIMVLALPLFTAPVEVKLMTIGGGHAWLVLVALVVGAAMGAYNLLIAPARWSAIVALVAFAIVGMKVSDDGDGLVKLGSGATGAMVFAFVGMILALVLAIKPGKKA